MIFRLGDDDGPVLFYPAEAGLPQLLYSPSESALTADAEVRRSLVF
jgi:hypothetical protein